MLYLLDTDTCIDVLRGLAAPLRKLEALSPDDCGVSTITSFELFAGAAKARRPQEESAKIEKFLEVIKEQPFDGDAARTCGELRIALDRAGTPVGPYDLLIAAHALVLGLSVVSANVSEFSRVPGLAVQNWR